MNQFYENRISEDILIEIVEFGEKFEALKSRFSFQ
jgi:hypothetical protein